MFNTAVDEIAELLLTLALGGDIGLVVDRLSLTHLFVYLLQFALSLETILQNFVDEDCEREIGLANELVLLRGQTNRCLLELVIESVPLVPFWRVEIARHDIVKCVLNDTR